MHRSAGISVPRDDYFFPYVAPETQGASTDVNPLGQFDPLEDLLEFGLCVIRRVRTDPVANPDAQVVISPAIYLSEGHAEMLVS